MKILSLTALFLCLSAIAVAYQPVVKDYLETQKQIQQQHAKSVHESELFAADVLREAGR